MKAKSGAFHVFWSGGSAATSPPFEEVGPTHVLAAAFEGEQGVGTGQKGHWMFRTRR